MSNLVIMSSLVIDLLDKIRVSGTAYIMKSVSAPWGMDIVEYPGLCRIHVVLSGSTWIGVAGSDKREQLFEGDFAIIPRGAAHYLVDEPERMSLTEHHIPPIGGEHEDSFIHSVNDNDATHLLCGYFHFTQDVPIGVHSRLPNLVIVRKGEGNDQRQVTRAIDMLEHELSAENSLSQPVLNRITEVMGYYTLKEWMNEAVQPGNALHSLTDPRLQRVLDSIHQQPAFPWTVEKLAEIFGQSRTAFAEYFRDATGLTPMAYIASWRTETASRLLHESNLSLDEIAGKIGYTDTSAFSRAFKRSKGVTPSVYKRDPSD